MYRSLGRQAIVFAIAAVAACTAVYAQYQSQRQDELGTMPAPASGINAPVQSASPLPTTPVQTPTITNNPDYARQPILLPAPYAVPQTPGQLQQPQSRQQQAPAGPRTSASEQRGRGAFT